jgi:hypothetical protein
MSFKTTSQIKNAFANRLRLLNLSSDMLEHWDDIINDCRLTAYNTIVSALAYRGFTSAQIASWSRGGEFEQHIALYWCFVETRMGGEDPTYIDKLNRALELADVPIVIDGELAEPESEDGGTVAGGVADTSDLDEFVRTVETNLVTVKPKW